MQRDQQRAAADGESELRQHGPEEDPPRIEPQRSRGILDGRIEAAQCCCDRQVEERVVGDDRDEDAALQAAHAGNQADPGITVHEGGHGERSDRQPGPEPRKRNVRPLGQPGERHRKRDRHRDGDRFQENRIDEKFTDARSEDQGLHRFPADIVGHPADEAERHETEDRDDGCEEDHGSVRHASAWQSHSRGPRRDRRLVAGCEQSVVLQQGRCLYTLKKEGNRLGKAVAGYRHALRFS